MRANTLPAILTRVQYAELRISGREGKLAMPRSGNGSATRLLVRLSLWITRAVMLLNFYCRGLILGNPQKIIADIPDKPVLIFTDGAVELNGDGGFEATVGGVIIGDGVTEVFGSRVDQAVLDEWLVELVHPVG